MKKIKLLFILVCFLVGNSILTQAQSITFTPDTGTSLSIEEGSTTPLMGAFALTGTGRLGSVVPLGGTIAGPGQRPTLEAVGTYGTLFLNIAENVNSANGRYTYTLSNNPATLALNAGASLEDKFLFRSSGGLDKDLTFTINGVNTPATFDGVLTGDITEDASPNTVVGIARNMDVDNDDNVFIAVAKTDTTYGEYKITTVGVWTYTLDNTKTALNTLNTGSTLTDTFTINSQGRTSQTITITINGANDAPTDIILSSSSVAENAGTDATVGTLSTPDVDSQSFTYTLVSVAGSIDNNALFNIITAGGVPNTLVLRASADFETKSSYSIRVNVNNGVDDFQKVFTIAVTDEDEAPVGVADTETINEDTSLVFIDVLGNDAQNGGSALTITSLTAPTNGRVRVPNSGTPRVIYIPNANFNGEDTFTYIPSNGLLTAESVTVTVTVNPLNDAPTITGTDANTIKTLTETDAGLTTSGTLTVADVDSSDTVTISVSGVSTGGGGNSNLPQSILNKLLSFFSVNTSTLSSTETTKEIEWEFNSAKSAPEAFNYLVSGQELIITYTITVTDDSSTPASAAQIVTITITGTNDAPVIVTEDIIGAVTELASPSPTDIITDTGTITFTDADFTDGHTIGSTITASAGALGTLTPTPTITQTGTDGQGGIISWTYSVQASLVEYLTAGQTKVETFTITLSDGNSADDVERTISVTITGTNDAPTITGTEITGSPSSNTGTLTVSDVDIADLVTASVNDLVDGDVTGTRPSLGVDLDALKAMLTVSPTNPTIDGSQTSESLTWTFTPVSGTFNYLAQGENLIIRYTVKVTDDSSTPASNTQTVTITITGTNTAPTITGDDANTIKTLTEADTTLTTSGTLTVSDANVSDTVTASVTGVTTAGVDTNLPSNTPRLLTFLSLDTVNILSSIQTSTTFDWSFDSDTEAFNYLASGEELILTYTITVTDNNNASNTQEVRITITGINDDPTITDNNIDHSFMEGNTGLTVSKILTVSDVDFTDVVTASVETLATDDVDGVLPSGVDLAALKGMLTVNPTIILDELQTSNSLTWTFNSGTEMFHYLALDETLIIRYTVKVTDDDSTLASDTQIVTITITGINDVPVVATTVVTAVIVEQGLSPSGDITVARTITFTDADITDRHTISNNIASAGVLGTLTPTITQTESDGEINWAYSVPADDVEYLAATETKEDTFTITLNDGNGGTVERTISVTTTGTNDAPIITGTNENIAHSFTETNIGLTVSKTLTVSDVDITNIVTAAITLDTPMVSGNAGSTPSVPAGANYLNLLSITTPTGNILSNAETTKEIQWTFNSVNEAFNYLALGETLTLIYTINSNRRHCY